MIRLKVFGGKEKILIFIESNRSSKDNTFNSFKTILMIFTHFDKIICGIDNKISEWQAHK
jgi:hypothetical protein